VREDKVADGISALDREGVVVKGLDEPGVLRGNKLTRLRVGPELECRVSISYSRCQDRWEHTTYS
jgi:hypothetical protein